MAHDPCAICSGSGALRCSHCGGSGINRKSSLLDDLCHGCKGTGSERCQGCRGTGEFHPLAQPGQLPLQVGRLAFRLPNQTAG